MRTHTERPTTPPSEQYDQESDVFYVTFNTGEPSYVLEVDDVLLIEMGLFSHTPTGFRVLNYTKSKVAGVQILHQKIEKAFTPMRKKAVDFGAREKFLEDSLEKVFA
ncbi:MAG: hypothetical protein PHC88_11360 [Terrimicrobiaceae bacterium]|nr:hypothetical protein [Terrimicrobiaceae bacterium]